MNGCCSRVCLRRISRVPARWDRGIDGGGPISNTRLVACAHRGATFRYRVNGEGADRPQRGLMTLPIAEFIQRYLSHVPPPGTKVVRGYRLYAPTKRAALARCREQLGQGPVVTAEVLDWQTAQYVAGE